MNKLLAKLYNLVGYNEKLLIVEISAWLIQRIKSDIRKNKPFVANVALLFNSVNCEFGITLTAEQLVKLIQYTKFELVNHKIELFADNSQVIANRPISSAMISTL